MAMPDNFRDREKQKFVECKNETAVRTKICQEDDETIKVEIDVSGVANNLFNEVNSVASGALTTIISYTVPVASELKLDRVSCSGDNVAKFTVELNSSVIDKRRTWWTNFNTDFSFTGLVLDAGDTLEVKVLHNSDEVGDFNAKILGNLG